jgi:hypothetical protein
MAIADVVGGQPLFFTPALLGSYLFYGVRDPVALTVWAGPVLAYNGAHLLIFLAFGIFMAGLAALADRGAQLWYVAVSIFLIIVPHVLGVPLLFAPIVRSAISLPVIIAATTMAAIVMAGYLWRAHPRLRADVLVAAD